MIRMIGRIFAGLVLVVLVTFGAFLAWTWRGEIAPIKPPAVTSFDPVIVAKGAQLAAIGNCGVCHTKAGGPAYAGGFPVDTPFGTIYGTNITPDPDTGIGSWTEAAFRRALREGVTRKGSHLYPAFPYDHFTQATDSDIAAVYAFLMTRAPVRQVNRPPELVFPLNARLFAAAWKLLFLHQGEYRPDRTESDQWNRGAYLAASFGHCGACHTPRNALGAEKRDEAFAGGQGEGWHAPALDAASPAPVPWTAEQLYAYLRTGFASRHGHVAGPMQPVVQNLRKASDADLRAIAAYIASLDRATNAAQRTQAALAFAQDRAAKAGPSPPQETTGAGASPINGPSGAAIFAGACAGCHHLGGALPASRPIALGLSTAVNAPDPVDLIRIVLNGIHPPPGERGMIMPGFSGTLTDAQVVALVAYMRTQFSSRPPWADVAGALAAVRRKPERRAQAP